MAIRFNADEVLAVAEKIEQNGARFYEGAAARIRAPRTQTLLRDLAEWEKTHLAIFTGLRAKLAEREKEPVTHDPLGEAALYLAALANSKVFIPDHDPLAALGDSPTPRGVILTAIGMEKDSIILYVGLRDYVPVDLGQALVERVLKEEMNHLAMLNRELAQLGENA